MRYVAFAPSVALLLSCSQDPPDSNADGVPVADIDVLRDTPVVGDTAVVSDISDVFDIAIVSDTAVVVDVTAVTDAGQGAEMGVAREPDFLIDEWSCIDDGPGEPDLEFPKDNPMNYCTVNEYPAGGDCYACALERCCIASQCCSSTAGNSFWAPGTTLPVIGCIKAPMECIQSCFTEANAVRGRAPSPTSRDIVDECSGRCIADFAAVTESPDDEPLYTPPHATFPAYARAWVDCLQSDAASEVDQRFRDQGIDPRRGDELPELRFQNTSCATACFPGY